MERQSSSAARPGSKAAADAEALARLAAQAEAAFAGTAADSSVTNGSASHGAASNGTASNGAASNSSSANGTAAGPSTVRPGAGNAGKNSGASNGTAADSTAAGPSACGTACGTLPAPCAPMAFPYIPMQNAAPVRYSRREALENGTLFPGLNLPFKAAIQAHTRLANTALVELMAIDFALQELGLYLNTHPGDQEVLQLFWSYAQLAKEGRERYQEQYGPLTQTDLTPEQGYAWLNDPWPWDVGGNR